MRPKVWDVFTFYNETLLLEVRKRELAGAKFDVEHVPIESLISFTGALREQALPDSFVMAGLAGDTPEKREEFLRRATKWALQLKDARPADYVLFGDVDEIPAATAVERAIATPGIKTLRMPYHSLLATWRLPLSRDRWNFRWPVLGTLAEFQALDQGWDVIRRESGSFERIENAGWHLSSMGGPAVVLDKVDAFSHAGEDWTGGLDAARLRDLATRGRDVADRFDQEPCPLWELPVDVAADPETFAVLLDVKHWPLP